ncbi:MAG: hypothetical protein R2710_12130 [Acidimicrobiales bacterium]
MLSVSIDHLRLFVHVLAASVWVGGQVILAGLVPRLRPFGPEAIKTAANGFAIVAWPAFVIAFVTGIWNMLAVDYSNVPGWNATLGIKILLVVAAGASAALHSTSQRRAIMAITGAAGGILALVILFMGIMLANPTS